MNIRKAGRKQAKIRLALQGPSGSGKTYSSLLIAKGLVDNWSKIVIIDTENFSADLYAHLGSFNVLSITPPYSPEKYIEAITSCVEAGMEVIMIRINVLEGVKSPLPPASLRDILEVFAVAVAFCALAVSLAAGVVFLLSKLLY